MSALSGLAQSNANFAFAAQLLRDLCDGGVVHVCICAGSRSAPLAATAATTPGLAWTTHVDERSAAFFALGVARVRRQPAALICTSGTAAANFLPAVAEASRSGVPLIVLTADRPLALRQKGGAQTIDQVKLYGRHVRGFHEALPPTEMEAPESCARRLAQCALREAQGPRPGPVHLNLPFCEPLDPSGERPFCEQPRIAFPKPSKASAPASWEQLQQALRNAERPVVVAGPWDVEAEERAQWLRWVWASGAALLAEPLSGLMTDTLQEVLVLRADALLRSERFASEMVPDLIVRLGGVPTSKAVNRWLARHRGVSCYAVISSGQRDDPEDVVKHWVEGLRPERVDFPDSQREASAWLRSWKEASHRAVEAFAATVAEEEAFLPSRIFPVLARRCAVPSTVVLSNSMSVRDAESFFPALPEGLRWVGNRGANGIDGLLSTALGVAWASQGERVYLIAGDLALLHDAAAWWTAKRLDLPLTVIALNDGGGGIFDHLPIARQGARVAFEEVFRVSHRQSLVPIVEAYGCEAHGIHSTSELEKALQNRGPQLLEVRFDPARSLAQHRACWESVERAMEGFAAP